MQKGFVHIHTHTAYSLLDGAGRIEDYVAQAKALGMPALAMTDHGVMHGAVPFYKACIEKGIKPIIGCEVYVAQRTRHDKEAGIDDSPYHLILLVKDDVGYRNLCRMLTLASVEGFYYRPRIDRELLKTHHKGLICSSACLSGEIPRLILSGRAKEAEEVASWYRDLFGPENFYLELQNHGLREQAMVNIGLAEISRKQGIPLVAANDCHYVYQEDAEVQDVMLCIQTGKTIDDPNRMKFDNDQFYLKSYEEMAQALPDYPQALDNTLKIAEDCNFHFDFNTNHMPAFQTPEGLTEKEYLRKICQKGLVDRYGEDNKEAQERLDYELNVIDQMGYNAYFLITWDFIDFANRQDIFVGPGRGSAAGSIVAYVLGITNVDPLKYDLLFERFLNPERVSMPDIDIDFCYERRGEVIDYVNDKYGQDHVSQIVTFGTMAAKGSIRDVGRVLDIPLATVNKIAKMIPNVLDITLEDAWKISKELNDTITGHPELEKLYRMARRLEGLPRHAGMHAAGVVISEEPMDHYLPLQKNAEGFILTQYAKDEVEEIGLLKMDFLGLRTLTVLYKTLDLIEKNHGIRIDLDSLDEKDPKTYEMLGKGDSIAVFQMEGTGLRAVLKDLKPTCLEDIIALVALYRPGPLGSGMIEDFIARKHGKKEVEYIHPKLEPILSSTYGVILYQEQVMQIAARLAGFSLGEADLLRRAMGKKKPEIITSLRVQFQEGCAKNGIDLNTSDKIFDLIAYFAGYGFNKSHSAAYGLLAFQTAYLKAHYPKEYMAEILNSFIDNLEKVTLQVAECRRMNIDVLPPDINYSGRDFTVTEEGIRFGLHAVKGVGMAPVRAILHEREKNGPFKSFQDLCLRVPQAEGLNKKSVESLILAGAFTSLGVGRKALSHMMDACMDQASAYQKSKNDQQVSFFDFFEESDALIEEIPVPDVGDFSREDNLKLEKEYLGIYISGHPLEDYEASIRSIHARPIAALGQNHDQESVLVAGLLTEVRLQTTKKGDLMAYAELEDQGGSIPLLVFPRRLDEMRSALIEDMVVAVRGKFQWEEEGGKIFCDEIMPLICDAESPCSIESSEENKRLIENDGRLFLRLSEEQHPHALAIIQSHRGTTPVYFHDPVTKKTLRLSEDLWVSALGAQKALSELLGLENVVFQNKV